MRTLLIVVALLGVVAAQGATYVVDRLGGPGTHFTEITTAVAAVPSGSTLLVRPGAYAPVLIDGKGIVILCDGGVTAGSASSFAPFLCVQNTLPQQPVAVRGLGTRGPLGCKLLDCAGPVTIDGVGAKVAVPWYFGDALHIVNCAQVAIRHCILQGSAACTTSDSSVVFEHCVLSGDAAAFQAAYPALVATDSAVQAVCTSFFGGRGRTGPPPIVTLPGSAAVVLTNASLRAIGTREQTIQGGLDPTAGQLPAIVGSGAARVGPQVAMQGLPLVGPQVALTRPTMPGLVCDSAPPGGTLTVVRRGALGAFGILAASPWGPSQTLPGIADAIWVDLGSLTIEAAAVVLADPWVVQRAVPNQAALIGTQLVWQTAELMGATIEVSNASVSLIR